MKAENTDPIELANDLREVSAEVINEALGTAGSSPMPSLLDGGSRLSYSVENANRSLNRYSIGDDPTVLRSARHELIQASQNALRLLAMIDNKLGDSTKRPKN